MNLPLRRGAASVACASPLIVVAAVAMAAPDRLASTFSGYANEVNAERRHKRVFEIELSNAFNRIDRKRALIANLNQGNIAFRDVVDEFLLLNCKLPGSMVCLRSAYPGVSDEEVVARNVLSFALVNMTGSFAEKLSGSARLLKGFREYVQSLPPDRGPRPGERGE